MAQHGLVSEKEECTRGSQDVTSRIYLQPLGLIRFSVLIKNHQYLRPRMPAPSRRAFVPIHAGKATWPLKSYHPKQKVVVFKPLFTGYVCFFLEFHHWSPRDEQVTPFSTSQGGAREAIVPVVYGFPSATSTAHFRRKTLMLTEVACHTPRGMNKTW